MKQLIVCMTSQNLSREAELSCFRSLLLTIPLMVFVRYKNTKFTPELPIESCKPVFFGTAILVSRVALGFLYLLSQTSKTQRQEDKKTTKKPRFQTKKGH